MHVVDGVSLTLSKLAGRSSIREEIQVERHEDITTYCDVPVTSLSLTNNEVPEYNEANSTKEQKPTELSQDLTESLQLLELISTKDSIAHGSIATEIYGNAERTAIKKETNSLMNLGLPPLTSPLHLPLSSLSEKSTSTLSVYSGISYQAGPPIRNLSGLPSPILNRVNSTTRSLSPPTSLKSNGIPKNPRNVHRVIQYPSEENRSLPISKNLISQHVKSSPKNLQNNYTQQEIEKEREMLERELLLVRMKEAKLLEKLTNNQYKYVQLTSPRKVQME